MGDLSENFSRHEFACKCGCGFNTVDVKLLEVLESLRTYFDKPVRINSAARCLKHNRAIGSTDSSQHVLGRAADIAVKSIHPLHVHNYIDSQYPCALGLGMYDLFTHVDTRNSKARWS